MLLCHTNGREEHEQIVGHRNEESSLNTCHVSFNTYTSSLFQKAKIKQKNMRKKPKQKQNKQPPAQR